MADLIETLAALNTRIDRLVTDLATMRGASEADAREIRTAIAGLTDALIDLTASVTLLDKEAAVAAGKTETRAETLVEVRKTLDAMLVTLDKIAGPLLAAEQARLEAEANKKHLFSQITPQRLAWAMAFVTATAAAGGFGANFRGCAAAIQTTADQQSATTEE